MELDADKLLEHAIRDGIREGVKSKFTGYSKPFDMVVEAAISKHGTTMRLMLEEAMATAINDPVFRAEIAGAVRHNLAKTLVRRFGGELEKQVNVLKSDPATRARITLAIEEIVKTRN